MMDEHPICSTASAPTPSATTATPITYEGTTKTCKRRTCEDVGQHFLSLPESSSSLSKSTNESAFLLEIDMERSRKDFARMIAKHCLPLDMGEHMYFRLYMRSLNPMVQFPSRDMVIEDVMDIFQEEKEKLYELLNKLSSRVSITTNLWTEEHQNCSYCVIFCHYIDDEWNLCKKIISYENIPIPHNGEAIGDHIKSQLLNWNLDGKLFSMVVDNVFTNDSTINHLKQWFCHKGGLLRNGEIFHVRCCEYILNLIIQDGLEEIREVLMKIQDMFKWINASPSRSEKFVTALAQTRLSNKKNVSLDAASRWNSTYEMLRNALEVREAFEHLAELDQNFNTLLSNEEWEKCKSIGQCLEVFDDVTRRMSSYKYCTPNFYLLDVCTVHYDLLQLENDRDGCIRSMGFTMRLKFQKYWEETSLFMALGVILDPRYKMEFIVFALNAIYGDDADSYIKKIKFDVADIYSEYAYNYGGSCCSLAIGDVSDCVGGNRKGSCDESSTKKTSVFSREFKKFMQQRSGILKNAQKSELDMYLEESLFPIGDNEYCFDILLWWKHHSLKFPILARMARDILAVPAAAVAPESAFSIGARLITENHLLLLPDVVEALICLQNWLPSYNSSTTINSDEESWEP